MSCAECRHGQRSPQLAGGMMRTCIILAFLGPLIREDQPIMHYRPKPTNYAAVRLVRLTRLMSSARLRIQTGSKPQSSSIHPTVLLCNTDRLNRQSSNKYQITGPDSSLLLWLPKVHAQTQSSSNHQHHPMVPIRQAFLQTLHPIPWNHLDRSLNAPVPLRDPKLRIPTLN